MNQDAALVARTILAMLADEQTPTDARVRLARVMLQPLADWRPATPAERKSKQRMSRGRDAPPMAVVESRDRDIVGGFGGGVSRGSLSKDSLSGSERTTKREREEASRSRDIEPSRETQVTLTDPITPELEAIASMIPVQDVAGCWLKFCGHYNGQRIEVPGRWQLWCVNEAKRERRERDLASRKPWQKPDPEPKKPIVLTAEDYERNERAYQQFKANGGSR